MTAAPLVVRVTASAADVAALQRDAEGLAAALADAGAIGTIDTPEEYAQIDAMLSEVVRRKDAAVAMRRSATGPMKEAVATVEGWFRPVVRALESCEGVLKGAIGRYRLAQAAAEASAREAAAQAAEAGDAPALLAALDVAADASAPPPGASTASLVWAVSCIDADRVPREFLMVDRGKLDALARGHKGDTPPEVPGVAFERIARIGARR